MKTSERALYGSGVSRLFRFQVSDKNFLLPDKSEHFFESISRTYAALGDDESRVLYNACLACSLSGNNYAMLRYNKRMSDSSHEKLKERLKERKSYIRGGGGLCRDIMAMFPDVVFSAVIDDFIGAQNVQGLPVLTFEEFTKLHNYKDVNIVVAAKDRVMFNEMKLQLYAAGIDFEKNCVDAIDYWIPPLDGQYFDLPELTINHREVLVNCGSYDGNDVLRFLNIVDNNYRHIYTFEPDKRRVPVIQKNLKHLERCEIVELGVGDKTGVVGFSKNHEGTYSASGRIFEQDSNNEIDIEEVHCVALDNFFKNKSYPPTFITMDIEGFEATALEGAKHIIFQHKPKLAICIYHRPDDIVVIPDLILNLNPHYTFYLRKYNFGIDDTVLYAI